MAEHLVGPCHIAASERTANGGATHRFAHSVDSREQFERLHVEVFFSTELSQQVDIAIAMTAEVEVFAHNDELGVEAPYENSVDE